MSTPKPTDATTPRPVVGMYSFFSTDPRRLAKFWSSLMQLPIAPGATDDLVMLDFDHEVTPTTWIFERRTDVATGSAPMALDIGVTDDDEWDTVAERAVELGAARLADREEGGVRWVELADPDGNRFRVFAPRPV